MDGSRFDGFSRTFAKGMNRRRALGGIGAGAVAAVAGTSLRRAAAQDATPAAGSGDVCMQEFTATVRQGPSAGTTLTGILQLPATETGAIDNGVLWLADEESVDVVGQATGRLIGLVFTVADGQTIYGTGVMENALAECGGGMGGTFSGPTEGDSGDWIGEVSQTAQTCQKCINDAGALYNDKDHVGRLIKACRAASLCP